MSVYIDQNPMPRRIRFDWIGEAFSIYSKNVGVWIGATLISIGVAIALGLAFGAYAPYAAMLHPTPGSIPTPMAPGKSLLYSVLSVIVSSFFYGGQFKMANKSVRGEPVSIGDLFSGGNVMLQIFGYNILFGLCILVGTLLCFLPVFVVYTALWPGLALVADGESAGSALSRSWNAVKQDWLNAGLFGFVVMLIFIISYIPALLGLFVTIPMTFIIGSLIYRDMIGMPGTGQEGLTGGPYYSAQSPTAGVWPPAPTQGVPPVNPFPQAPNPFPQTQEPSSPFPPPSDPYAPPPPSPPQSGE